MKKVILLFVGLFLLCETALAEEFHMIGFIDGRGIYTEQEDFSRRIDISFVGGQMLYFESDGKGNWVQGPYLEPWGKNTWAFCGPIGPLEMGTTISTQDDFQTIMYYYFGHPELGCLIYTAD